MEANYIETIATNKAEIEHVKKETQLIMQQLSEKIDSGFKDVNNRLDSVDARFDELDKTLPSRIDERIKLYYKDRVFQIIRWAVVVAGSSITITVVTKMILKALKLGWKFISIFTLLFYLSAPKKLGAFFLIN